ncbi:MAG: 8-amino-7-oxononanoate synthase [Bacteroidetes bacterium RIFCSPLOWO2_02_FULL_36_8]|nr:MAG: 8-amino-7-oxononanoate synthase [Bacteroidetes bacterium RIFCSPLOWO2_02_FULL_36_8]OFY68772.1 MAG: 8-amino-7-oxononanoate synthase [Bacteroidetes bacterium RIFCSPLOWO2_12_FULL_37_12]
MDLFEKLIENPGPLGKYSKAAHGYFTFPKLEGEISNRMFFRGKEVIVWSLNNYLGLANHPEVRKTDAEAAKTWGLAAPMGARMMSGNTKYHEELEEELSSFVKKEDTLLLNYGYQGVVSIIDCLVDRKDVVVYDAEAHACIVDGVRLHQGKRFVFPHNDMENLEVQLQRAVKMTKDSGGGILVISEGVFGMAGDIGDLKKIVELKNKYPFRLFVDDAHGFGTMGKTGSGTGEELGVQNEIDLYFSTFAKSMSSIGAFVSGKEQVIEYLRYNTRSQIFAKSMPMPLVIGNLKRLELLKNNPSFKDTLWNIAMTLQKGLTEKGFQIGKTQSPVTPIYLSGTVDEALNLTVDLRENHGIFASIVVYPVVPKDIIMLRLMPTAVHTMEDVNQTITAFEKVSVNLAQGAYSTRELVGQV